MEKGSSLRGAKCSRMREKIRGQKGLAAQAGEYSEDL
jgi:hypothetical protein